MARQIQRLVSWMGCGLLAVLGGNALAQGSVDVAVTIRADQPGPVINPNIYGQFAEHLGAGIYEGVWVGPGSPVARPLPPLTDVNHSRRLSVKIDIGKFSRPK